MKITTKHVITTNVWDDGTLHTWVKKAITIEITYPQDDTDITKLHEAVSATVANFVVNNPQDR